MQYDPIRTKTLKAYRKGAYAQLMELAAKIIQESPERLDKTALHTASDYMSDMCGDLFGLREVEVENEEIEASFPYVPEPQEVADIYGGRP